MDTNCYYEIVYILRLCLIYVPFRSSLLTRGQRACIVDTCQQNSCSLSWLFLQSSSRFFNLFIICNLSFPWGGACFTMYMFLCRDCKYFWTTGNSQSRPLPNNHTLSLLSNISVNLYIAAFILLIPSLPIKTSFAKSGFAVWLCCSALNWSSISCSCQSFSSWSSDSGNSLCEVCASLLQPSNVCCNWSILSCWSRILKSILCTNWCSRDLLSSVGPAYKDIFNEINHWLRQCQKPI